MTRDDQIAAAVDLLDTRDNQEQELAWSQLRPLGFGVVKHLCQAFPRFSTWQGRTALVYYATRYARICEDAFQLGLAGLGDKSYMVRYRACGLLAYSLRSEALPRLEDLAQSDKHSLVHQSALAAANAIKSKNHHLYADRSLSGQTTWSVNPGDISLGEEAPPLPGWLARKRLGIRPVPTS